MKRFTLLYKCITAFILLMSLSGIESRAGWDTKTEIYSFTAGRWGAQLITVDGKIFAGGGYHGNNSATNDWQEYDIANDTWTNKNPMPGTTTNRSGGVTFTINGKAYLGLGIENFNNFTLPWNFLTDLWEYDPDNDTWTKMADFPGTGTGFCGVFVLDNKAYVVGGSTGKLSADGTNEVYEYDPATDKWTQKASYPETYIKDRPFGFSAEGKGYISCGSTSSGATDKTYEYDPAADSWTEKAAYAGGVLGGGVTFVANGVPYCGLGSKGGSDYQTVFYTYNAAEDNWSYAAGFEFTAPGRKYAIAAVVNNEVYLGAGWRIDGGASAQTWFKDWYQLDAASAVNINKVNAESDVKVYPNPARDVIYINSDNFSQYEFLSVTGKKLMCGEVNSERAINVSELPVGTYLLQLTNDNGNVFAKKISIR